MGLELFPLWGRSCSGGALACPGAARHMWWGGSCFEETLVKIEAAKAPDWLSRWSMQLDLGVVSSSPILGVEITPIKSFKKTRCLPGVVSIGLDRSAGECWGGASGVIRTNGECVRTGSHKHLAN